MAIAYVDAGPRLSDPHAPRNIIAAKVAGTGLVSLLADALKGYDVGLVTAVDGRLRIVVQVQGDTAACPACKRMSSRVHSRYWRSPTDVTAFGLHLELHVYARRFRCEERGCPQRYFAERLPDIPAWARRSDRVTTLLAYTALSVGGLPGRRVARLYGLDYSRHTLLRAARRVVTDRPKTVEVLGVDDYAYRRGVNYGTLLYDFRERRVIDLLPERSAEFLATWLRAHPDVKVISRDRGGSYAQGAREGAPQAIQVADRFHLMQNLGDCLERLAERGIHVKPTTLATEPEPPPPPSAPPRPPSRAEQAKAATRQRRQRLQDAIRDLAQQGASIRTIARTLHISRKRVRGYLQSLPDNVRAPQLSICDRHAAYLHQRWDDGVQNAHQLYEEICHQGYTGSESNLRHYLRPWRVDPPAGAGSRRPTPKAEDLTVSPRAFRRLVLKNLRTAEEDALLARIGANDPLLATSTSLAHDFATAIHAHDVPAFDAWLDRAALTGAPVWKGFTDSLRRDIDAVHHGILLQWSQGPVEGSINRLKSIKRTMYGRGGHDLLRRRVIFHLPD